MIFLSGITDAAIALVFGIFLVLSLVSYFAVYKILILAIHMRDCLNELKAKKLKLFYLAHLLIYFLSCIILFGLLKFKQFIFD
jgi:hypothetical protein